MARENALAQTSRLFRILRDAKLLVVEGLWMAIDDCGLSDVNLGDAEPVPEI